MPDVIVLHLACGRQVEFKLPDPNPEFQRAVFVLGVRKSGSTLFNRLAMGMARRYAVPFVDVGGGFFSRDLKATQWVSDPEVAKLFRPGAIYGGFRTSYDHFTSSEVYRGAAKILLVRDPRDALVSQYFSTLKTHSLPKLQQGGGGAAELLLKQRAEAATLSVDDYVLLNARAFLRTLQGYLPLLDDPSLTLFHYEDVVMKKEPWIHKMLDAMGLPRHKGFIQRMLDNHDIQPSTENTSEFVRKVTPGDHREKLRAPTIEALNLIFGDVGRRFGYKLRHEEPLAAGAPD